MAPGTTLERYVIEGRLGAGGMGIVYRARHAILGSLHAIKVVRPGTGDADRMLDEARAQACLAHPNVLPVTDVLPFDGGLAIVMEHIAEGRNLQMLLREGPLALDLLDRLANQIFAGVDAAHTAGLLHRDLKPANILLHTVDNAHVARIADFGLVQNLGGVEQAGDPQATMGTPGYAAPEQLLGSAPLDVRADVFSLGATLFEMLTGQRAFGKVDSITRFAEAQLTERPRVTHLRRDAPPRMADAIEAALQWDRARRPATVVALAAAWRGHPLAPPQRVQAAAHPTLDQFLEHPEDVRLQAHLARCPRCRVALKLAGHTAQAPQAPPPQTPSLPVRLDAFIGRHAERQALAQLIAQNVQLVTILGPGGVGKTRLALHVGAGAAVSGGVWFCDLQDAWTLDAMFSALARTLGVPLDGVEPVVKLGHAMHSLGRALIILDNLEQLLPQASTALKTWLSIAPEACLVVTSRVPPAIPGASTVALAPLPQHDAVQLFVARASELPRPPVLTDRASVARLVTRLDGLPLAIELAAARLSLFTVDQLDDRLSDRFRLLRTTTVPATDRHATLWATLDWSWSLLDPDAQRALARCSVFRGGMSTHAAEVVVGPPSVPGAAWPEETLQVLIDNSLIQVGTTDRGDRRLTLLESIRAFAADKLAELPDASTSARHHARHFARLGTPGALEGLRTHGGPRRLRTLIQERDNIAVAQHNASKLGEHEVAACCALATAAICTHVGPLPVAAAALEHCLSNGGLSAPRRLDLKLALAAVLARVRRIETATTLCEDAIQTATRLGLHVQLGHAHAGLGHLRSLQGDPAAARAHAETALGIFQQAGAAAAEATILRDLGVNHMAQGDFTSARAHLTAALTLHQQLGDRRAEGRTMANLGLLSRHCGDFSEAEKRYKVALHVLQDIGDRQSEGSVLSNLAIVYRDMGRDEDARQLYAQALTLHQRLGNRRSEGIVRGNLGTLLMVDGNLVGARAQLDTALAIHRELGNPRSEAIVRVSIASVCRRQGELSQAFGELTRALALTTAQWPLIAASCHRLLAGVCAAQGNLDQARRHLHHAERMVPPGAALDRAAVLCQRCEIEWEHGDRDIALKALDEATLIATAKHAGPMTRLGVELHARRTQVGREA